MMANKQEKGNDKGFLSRAATSTSKRARRAQEKFMQKVGKSEETKDEVFDEFVSNFSKQQGAVSRLQKELKQYLQCVASMQLASNAFAEAVKEIYEPEWSDQKTLLTLFEELDSNFKTLTRRLADEVLEPIDAYHRPFTDVKTKISKRSRKRVDYDHCRHVVDTLRAKGMTKSADAKKLTQAEDDYQKAKSVFVDLTSELYDELPALYDGRIGFYVSCFQSVFTLEEVFHRENARIQHQLNDLMDQLIKDVSAGTYSTKKSFAVTRDEDQDVPSIEPITPKSSEGGLATFYDVAVPHEGKDEQQGQPDCVNGEAEQQSAIPIQQVLPPIPSRPAPQRPNSTSPSDSTGSTEPAPEEPTATADEVTYDTPESCEEKDQDAHAKTAGTISNPSQSQEFVVYQIPKSQDNPQGYNLQVPQSTFKVVATHAYSAEDEDEISFEKGEIIHVIPFDDPEEQDEGWLMGVLDSSGLKGVFPENFTKRLET